jgi:RimJ/RimL family protein N-acetyltransferase
MKPITFHKATLTDVQTLVDYRIRFALELTGAQTAEAIHALKVQMTAYFSSAMQADTCISFIATSEGEVAGIGSLQMREQPGNFKNPSGRWGYIMNMYTVPEFRRRGICKEILNRLVEAGENAGITAFELHATPEGQPVYLKSGFAIHSEPTLRKLLE